MPLKTYFLFITIFLSLVSCRPRPAVPERDDSFDKAALQAAASGDLTALQAAHAEGADLNYQDSSTKDSALLLAILSNEADSHKGVIDFLRQNGARDDLENKVQLTAQKIEEGKKKGKFLSTISSGGKIFKLPADCISLSAYLEQDEKFSKTGDTKPLGKGSQGTAFLVYRKSDWSLWAPKFPNAALAQGNAYKDTNEKDLKEFQRDDRDVMLSMKYGFGNPVEVEVGLTPGALSETPIGGIPYAMKSGITGGTLKDAIESGLLFAEKEEDVASREELIRADFMRNDLSELFRRMAWGRKAYADLNPDNLMWKYDDPNVKTGGQWVVIDAKAPEGPSATSDPDKDDPKLYSYEEAWKENFDFFLKKLPVFKPLSNTYKTYQTYRAAAQTKLGGLKKSYSLYLPEIKSSKHFGALQALLKKIQDDPPKGRPELGNDAEKAQIIKNNLTVGFAELVDPKNEAKYRRYRRILTSHKKKELEAMLGGGGSSDFKQASEMKRRLLFLPGMRITPKN